MIKKILIALLVILVLIQFIRPAKNVSDAAEPQAITNVYPVPGNVNEILKKACYDCHSNNTRYPWYSNIQPVYWWLNDHIQEGKEELNFSEFGTYNMKRRAKKLKKVAGEVKEGEMPLNSYTWMHKEAVLTQAEIDILVTWSSDLSKKIALENNIDLTEKKEN